MKHLKKAYWRTLIPMPKYYLFLFFYNCLLISSTTCEENKKSEKFVTNSLSNISDGHKNEKYLTLSKNNNFKINSNDDESNYDQLQLEEHRENEFILKESLDLDNHINSISKLPLKNNLEKNVSNQSRQEPSHVGIKNKMQDSMSLQAILMKLMIGGNSSTDIDVKSSPQSNVTETDSLNVTDSNITTLNNTNSKKCFCVDVYDREAIKDVEIINSTFLLSLLNHDTNITSRSVPTKCYLVYFFSPHCPFSAQGSAYVNALARSLRNIPIYGLDSIEFHSMNARYGVMGTPSLILFHNGNTVARYNSSEYSTYNLESFIHHFTNQVIESINVTSNDFKVALPSKVLPASPYALYAAWIFLITCSGWLFFNSEFYAKLTEAVLNNWREAEAQHAHDD